MSEQIIKTCSNSTCGKQFNIIPPEVTFLERKKLPLPTKCPSCRHEERMALRSERRLYTRECAKTGQKILSVYPPEAPYTIYSNKAFWENI